MQKTPEQKKKILTVTVNPETIDFLKKYKLKSGVSASWIVNSLLLNYLKSWEELHQK